MKKDFIIQNKRVCVKQIIISQFSVIKNILMLDVSIFSFVNCERYRNMLVKCQQ